MHVWRALVREATLFKHVEAHAAPAWLGTFIAETQAPAVPVVRGGLA